MNLPNISATLDGFLATLVGLPDVEWQNVPYTPKPNEAYIRPIVITLSDNEIDVGQQGSRFCKGYYKIEIYTPANRGKKPLHDLQTKLSEHFGRNKLIERNGTEVRTRRIDIGRPVYADGWEMSVFYVYFSNIY